MNNRFRLYISALAFLLVLMVPVAAFAQQTTSSIRVSVGTEDGGPIEGASVTVTDTRSGTTRTSLSGPTGVVNSSGLRVGGPYQIVVKAEGYPQQTITEIDLVLGETFTIPITVDAGSTMEEVIVTAAMSQTQNIALGPASVFGLRDLQEMPSVNRDIKDVIRADPRLFVDEADNGAINCAGANSRFNSFTLDGARMNDNFGLNRNGWPTERQPFPFDSIQQVAVEMAPFDVQYGGFSACNINAVSKSGDNQWHGSAFYDYTNDSMKGDKIENDRVDNGDFDEKRYGFTLSGPILKDRLFFFVAAERLEGVEQFQRGVAGSGAAVEVLGVSQSQWDEIIDIATNKYGYVAAGLPRSLPIEDEKITAKIDWNITDNHRAVFSYNWNDGYSLSEPDGDSNELEDANHYYERGAELTVYTGMLFSNWTDKFSTEFRITDSELLNRQLSLGGTDFGEVTVTTYNNGERANVYLGSDDSRHANVLEHTTRNYKLAGTYIAGDHVITGGLERDELEIFNMFIQEAEGEFDFDGRSQCSSSNPNGCIDAFRMGIPDEIIYQNASPTNIKSDAAAQFEYQVNSAYLQDEFTLAGGDVTLVAGLRYDWYSSSDLPRESASFKERNGFTNAENMDGKDLWQPRLGVNWEVNSQLALRGGLGLYGGGNPNVWISNNYNNDGQTQVRITHVERILDALYPDGWTLDTVPHDGTGRVFWDVPQAAVDAVASAKIDGDVNAISPTFKLPSVWKFSFGLTYEFDAGAMGKDYVFNADVIYSKSQDSANIERGDLYKSGSAPDGRPIYSSTRLDGNRDFILTNVKGPDAKQLNVALSLGKYYENGMDWTLSYAYNDAKDVNPMNRFTASSSYADGATADPQNQELARSYNSVKHRATFRIAWQKYWWGNNRSLISLFAHYNSGRPYAHAFGFDSGDVIGDEENFRHLLYVPTGPDDPNVVFGEDFDTEEFFAFVDAEGLTRGQIVKKYGATSPSWFSFDLKLEQEFPAFRDDHKFAGFLVIKNLCNLLNSEWCVLERSNFNSVNPVDIEDSLDNGRYVFDEYNPVRLTRYTDQSLYEIRIGLRYNF